MEISQPPGNSSGWMLRALMQFMPVIPVFWVLPQRA
jgi:hypothetical protein